MEQFGFKWKDFRYILYLCIFLKCVEKIQVLLNLTIITGNLHEDQYTRTLMTLCCSIHLRMRYVSDKNFRENQSAHFMFSKFFSKIVPYVRPCGKILYNRTGRR
jgi:hypothetical protein